MAKYVVYGLDGDAELPVLATVPNTTDLGIALISVVGVGYPYWAFESLPAEILGADSIGADFTDAPLCNADAQTNRNNLAGLYASPPATGVGGKVWAAS